MAQPDRTGFTSLSRPYWLENTHPAPVRSALELLRAVSSPHCSSLSTRTTAHLKTPLSSSWSLQTTPHRSASSRTKTTAYRQGLKELAVWCSLNNLELNTLKQWRWSWTLGETPPLSPTHHHEQHCDCSGVIQVPGLHHLSGPEVGHSHWVHC